MANIKQIEKKTRAITVQSQTDRLNKSLYCFREPETEALANFGNSIIGHEIEELRRCTKEQQSIIDAIDVTGYVNELEKIREQKKQAESIENLIFEQNLLNNELVELNKELIKSYRSQKELSQQLTNLKMERYVLNHLIKSTIENNDKSK
ncbi:uncharacterized protein LOC112682494 [Sipha flava]|jgi:ribosomal protein S8|uniref:Uncharacterized protein LOC112682494 n=1 Tax=Sipha flava TaxID=143950 RepID=A0A8B8FEJ8_9HEMI|nr:uncharacterized protein LOC112682494 [Sipha flava]